MKKLRNNRLQRNAHAARLKRRGRPQSGDDVVDDDPPLTRAQMRELDRRVKDTEDRTRYLLVNVFTRKFALYYDVSDDMYAVNSPENATLFKRRRAALAIRRLLGDRVEITRCRVDRRGRLVIGSVPRLRGRGRRAPMPRR